MFSVKFWVFLVASALVLSRQSVLSGNALGNPRMLTIQSPVVFFRFVIESERNRTRLRRHSSLI